jgi:hypothetical protein
MLDTKNLSITSPFLLTNLTTIAICSLTDISWDLSTRTEYRQSPISSFIAYVTAAAQ